MTGGDESWMVCVQQAQQQLLTESDVCKRVTSTDQAEKKWGCADGMQRGWTELPMHGSTRRRDVLLLD